MSPRSRQVDDRLYDYILKVGLREPEALAALRRETDAMPDGHMRSSPEQMQLLALLIELCGMRQVLEIGCFTGYGTLAMALALPEDGRLITLDVNDHWAAIGRRYWREAGVEQRIEFRSGLALESLDRLLDEGRAESFDLSYVDADKKTYGKYFERALALTRPGGLIALDNMFWGGAAADPQDERRQPVALRGLTAAIHEDQRVSPCLLPIGDGLMLARRR